MCSSERSAVHRRVVRFIIINLLEKRQKRSVLISLVRSSTTNETKIRVLLERALFEQDKNRSIIEQIFKRKTNAITRLEVSSELERRNEGR